MSDTETRRALIETFSRNVYKLASGKSKPSQATIARLATWCRERGVKPVITEGGWFEEVS